jgi:U3 small nucleolar RNA-associated protein 14
MENKAATQEKKKVTDSTVATETTQATDNLSTTGGKKRKLEETFSCSLTEASSNRTKKSNQESKTLLDQEELVRRAFAFAHEGEDEISKEKERIASQDADAKSSAEVAKLVGMSGWGSWAGDGVRVSNRQKIREEKAKQLAEETRQRVLASRKDSKMDRVLINEKKDRKASKFMAATVPYPFTSREEYEMAMRNPLGQDWNTPSSSIALNAPKIITRAGKIINPLTLSKEQKKEAKKQLMQQRKAKF